MVQRYHLKSKDLRLEKISHFVTNYTSHYKVHLMKVGYQNLASWDPPAMHRERGRKKERERERKQTAFASYAHHSRGKYFAERRLTFSQMRDFGRVSQIQEYINASVKRDMLCIFIIT